MLHFEIKTRGLPITRVPPRAKHASEFPLRVVQLLNLVDPLLVLNRWIGALRPRIHDYHRGALKQSRDNKRELISRADTSRGAWQSEPRFLTGNRPTVARDRTMWVKANGRPRSFNRRFSRNATTLLVGVESPPGLCFSLLPLWRASLFQSCAEREKQKTIKKRERKRRRRWWWWKSTDELTVKSR